MNLEKSLAIAVIMLFVLAVKAEAQKNMSVNEDCFKSSETGVTTRDFTDSSRPNWTGTGARPLRSVIWYPAGKGGSCETIVDSSQFPQPVKARRDAKISPIKKKYPLILLSHGAQGNAMQMRWLGYFLACKGYIAVAINHNGTDEEERKTGILSLSDFCMWERPKDVSAVLDKMLNDSEFSGRIDTGRIAVAGFSLGGATAIWVTGAILDKEELVRDEPEPPPVFRASIDRLIELQKTDPIVINSFKHSADSFKDSRIKAAFALAPAIGQGFTREGLKNITIPVQIVVGDADVVAPKERNAAHYADNIPGARPLIVLPGERGHYLAPASGTGRSYELLEVSKIAYSFFEEVFQ